MTVIGAIELWQPGTTTRVADLPEYPALDAADRDLVDRFGIETVRESDLTASELAANAVTALLERTGLGRDDVDALLVIGGRAPEYLVASESTRVQHLAGLDGTLAFGVSDLGCASISAALLTARALLVATPSWRNVVIAHGCRPPGRDRVRRPVTVNGDAGMAVLVRQHDGARLLDVEVETDGRYWDLFRVDYRDVPADEWGEVCADVRRYSFQLAVDSRNRLADLARRVCARNGVELSEVDHVVMQNLSVGAFRFYEDAFGVEVAKACRVNLRDHGHLGSIDVMANLDTGVRDGEFAPGDLVLVLNNSPVAAWSSLLIEV